jgi:hypothetical protein
MQDVQLVDFAAAVKVPAGHVEQAVEPVVAE